MYVKYNIMYVCCPSTQKLLKLNIFDEIAYIISEYNMDYL